MWTKTDQGLLFDDNVLYALCLHNCPYKHTVKTFASQKSITVSTHSFVSDPLLLRKLK